MIYLLEDDNSIRELVLYTLDSAGMEARGFDRPSTFWDAMAEGTPDLVILDIMLPQEDGLSILRRLRADKSTRRLPVMLLTAKSTEFDKVLGLDSGADDYVAKPFGMMELLSRIKALLRRTAPEPIAEDAESEYHLGRIHLSTAEHTVRVDGKSITLTLKEFELLSLLLRHPGKVFSRDQLLNQIWGYSFDGENRTVDVHVRTLRQKLGECGDYIETVRGVGYKVGGTPG